MHTRGKLYGINDIRHSDRVVTKALGQGFSMRMSPRYIQVQILTALTLLFVGTSCVLGQAVPAAPSDFKVTLLGTSTPNPLPDRFGPSTLVEAGNERLLSTVAAVRPFGCGN
jgi:hypothetical protein